MAGMILSVGQLTRSFGIPSLMRGLEKDVLDG